MPINKNAFVRYKILDKCFGDKYHKYFIENLMEKVNEQLEDAGNKPVSKNHKLLEFLVCFICRIKKIPFLHINTAAPNHPIF